MKFFLRSSDTKPEHEHIYRPLKPDEIRLLILNPGEEVDQIECYLEQYSVNAPKFYMALSYVWGDVLDSRFITLDGCDFPVSRNLESFLRSFRRSNDCCSIWIDQISINQADIPERNSQIRLMKRVYEGADQIIIWLGDPREHVESALVRINRTYNKPIIIDDASIYSSSELNSRSMLGLPIVQQRVLSTMAEWSSLTIHGPTYLGMTNLRYLVTMNLRSLATTKSRFLVIKNPRSFVMTSLSYLRLAAIQLNQH